MTEQTANEMHIGSHEVTLVSLTLTGTQTSVERMMADMMSAGIQFMTNGRSRDGDSYTVQATAYKIQPKE